MVGSGRIIGLVLLGLGIVILAGAGIWVFSASNQAGSQLQSGGAALTMGCALLVAAVVGGFGVWFLMQGRSEASQFADVEKQKKILNIIATQGTVQLGTVALETNMSMDQVKNAIYELAAALRNLQAYRFPVQMNEATRRTSSPSFTRMSAACA